MNVMHFVLPTITQNNRIAKFHPLTVIRKTVPSDQRRLFMDWSQSIIYDLRGEHNGLLCPMFGNGVMFV